MERERNSRRRRNNRLRDAYKAASQGLGLFEEEPFSSVVNVRDGRMMCREDEEKRRDRQWTSK